MRRTAREKFDSLLEEVLAELPPFVRDQLEEIPVIVEDEPNKEVLEDMGLPIDGPSDLCGLHSGVPLPERSATAPAPEGTTILIFRGPIQRLAEEEADELKTQIRITLLHEIGHHFGFSEEALEAMGYG